MQLRTIGRSRQFSRRHPKINNVCQSLSTQSSQSPREYLSCIDHTHHHFNKEKLQLCRKFMEHGYCPYQKKCKFAHGSHQLRRNDATNLRYKTKQCGSFFNNGFCSYGNRCNFLHMKKQKDNSINQKWKLAKINFREILEQGRSSSRFIKLFQ